MGSSAGVCCPQVAAVMWVMTYVGAIFNGVTLLLIGGSSVKSVNHLPMDSNKERPFVGV